MVGGGAFATLWTSTGVLYSLNTCHDGTIPQGDSSTRKIFSCVWRAG